jgi:hypothetical protein
MNEATKTGNLAGYVANERSERGSGTRIQSAIALRNRWSSRPSLHYGFAAIGPMRRDHLDAHKKKRQGRVDEALLRVQRAKLVGDTAPFLANRPQGLLVSGTPVTIL